MEWLRLIGIPIVLLGFLLRLKVTAVVLTAGLVTGLVAAALDTGVPDLLRVLNTLGKAFVDGRVITLFVLMLPAIGLAERYGLQEQSRALIARVRAATTGRLLFVYHLFRVGVVALGIRLGSGHVTFSRPLVVPMGLEAAGLHGDEERVEEVDRVKGAAGASENYANFFGQNLSPLAGGVALVVYTLASLGHPIDAKQVAFFTIPVTLASLVAATVQYTLLDRWLRRRASKRAEGRDA